MRNKRIFDRLAQRIDSYQQAMIDLQIGLIAIPALSPENGGDGEYKKSQFLSSAMKSLGFPKVSQLNAPDSRVSSRVRPNLFVTLPGSNTNRTAWILTHMDIVPPGERSLWTHDPYQGYVRGGKLYGRGSEDNQQDMVASLFAFKAFLDEGITPEINMGLAFVSDEEKASELGLQYILEHKGNPFSKNDLILVPDFGNEDGSVIEIAEKSLLWLRIVTKGRQCHGSKPSRGCNAFLAASHLAVKLNQLHRIFSRTDELYDLPASTFQPTKKEANVPNINTIPGEDVFYMDCRILPDYSLEDVMSEIDKIAQEIEDTFSVVIDISPVHQVQAPAPTPSDAPVVLALSEAIYKVYHVSARTIGIGAGTVAAFFRHHGYPAAVWCRSKQTAHQPDEYCLIANMLGNAKVYAYLLLEPGENRCVINDIPA